jgi:ADP-L-glycero-D-manno-heptose 6-epimerase
MRALVTGGTGFIGSNLTRRLLALGHEVIITGNQTEQQVGVGKILEPSLLGIDWRQIHDIDVTFHLAANNDTLCTDRDAMMRANVEASEYLFEKCLKAGCRKFIYASSTAVYGNEPAPYVEDKTLLSPLNWYGESKAILEEAATMFAEENNVQMVGLRYCNVYGPGESHKGHRASMIYQIIVQMRNRTPPKLFKYGEQRRDYIHIDDAVEANLRAWEYDKSDIFNCGGGTATSFIDIYHNIADAMYYAPYNLSGPLWIDNPYEKTYQSYTECDMKKARTHLGFEPKVSIKEGIRSYVTACDSVCAIH